MNLHWPHRPENGLAPWYLIAWRLPWFAVIRLGQAIYFVGALGYYFGDYRRSLRDVFG